MFLDTWFPMQGDLEPYPNIELTSRQQWNPHKIESPQKTFCASGGRGAECLEGNIMRLRETPRDTDHRIYGDTIGDFRSHSEEVVVREGMGDFHRCLVARVSVTATHVSDTLTVNRYKTPVEVNHACMDDYLLALASEVTSGIPI